MEDIGSKHSIISVFKEQQRGPTTCIVHRSSIISNDTIFCTKTPICFEFHYVFKSPSSDCCLAISLQKGESIALSPRLSDYFDLVVG